MDNNDNWLNQNPSEKKQSDISSIPEINTIPDIPGQDQHNQKHDFVANNNNNPVNDYQQQDFSKQQNTHNNSNTSSRTNAYSGIRLHIPNSGGILSLGILSILSICCCGGFVAPILSIIALVMASSSMKVYNQNPDYYTLTSLNNLKAGKITAIIGLVLAGFFLLYILFVYTMGNLNMNDINETINESWNGTGY
ncbi:MAG: CCC motif membrane protein [Bacteroidales bacterium]|nr:CCC motif membrane protein [Bacteroidales bacterium]